VISYAQNREDVVLARAFAGRRTGFYIDVGAEDPVAFSVTKHFYDLGWRGINVEPTAGPFAALEAARPDDINLCVGLADFEGAATLFEGPPDNHGSSTFDPRLAEDLAAHGAAVTEVVDVPITTLANVCKEWVGERAIDFLKIDVEGWERAVIDGADWDRWRPRVIVIEAVVPNTPTPSHHDWEPTLLEAGYVCTLFDGLNRFYARADDPELHQPLSVAANLFDEAIDFRHAHELRNLRQQVNLQAAEIEKSHTAVDELGRERDRQVADLVRERDRQVAALEQAVAEANVAVQDLGQALGERDLALRDARRALHVALDQLAQAEDEIALQDVEAAALRQRSADAVAASEAAAATRSAIERELAALEATKTFRWTRRARSAYGWARRRRRG
jgi:FkbM family methyltransferase